MGFLCEKQQWISTVLLRLSCQWWLVCLVIPTPTIVFSSASSTSQYARVISHQNIIMLLTSLCSSHPLLSSILVILSMILSSSSSSALQLFVSFGLLNYSFPWFPFLCLLFPIIYSHLPQIVSHVIIPSLSWPSFRSCCVWFSFINAFNYSFIRHSFNMSHPTQSLTFNVPYYIFVFNQVFQLLICFLSPFSICFLRWAKNSSQ